MGLKDLNHYPFHFHFADAVCCKSFRTMTLTKSGIQNHQQKQIIVLPNPESSEDENDSSDDEEAGFERTASNMKESNFDDESDFREQHAT